MTPKLLIINGPSQGTAFALSQDETFIGREPSNQICLPDPSVSRRHCLIRKEAEQYQIIDLDSFNGTLVNGLPVTQKLLTHGDQISIGDSLLFFLSGKDCGDTSAGPVQLDEGRVVAGSTLRLRREEALYFGGENLAAAPSQRDRTARDLNTLLKISTVINSIRSLGQLQEQLLSLLFEAVPAESGALLLVGKNISEVVSTVGRNKHRGAEQPVRVSQTVVTNVLKEGVAVLANDIGEGEPLGGTESLAASKTSSVICAPLDFFGSTLGVLYLNTTNRLVKFDENHLQLAVAIANIAAVAIENALHLEWLESENRQLQSEIQIKHSMIGNSPVMRKVYHAIAQVAPTDLTVLIRGESGTGKELAARAIHLNSRRVSGPFVPINCATLKEELIESELFGHQRGAFTSAVAQKQGLLEIAHGGTVFLDEVGELAPASQAKLLRVIEEGEFKRVGGTQPIKVDVRLITATNKDLESAIKHGFFREDLFYRLNVFSLVMPPLRARGDDIIHLAGYFVTEASKRHQRRVLGITTAGRARLKAYAWPGNVRELKNAIERAVVMSTNELVDAELLPETSPQVEAPEQSMTPSIYDAVKDAQKLAIINAYQRAQGNYTEAARILGVHPNHLHRLIRTLGIKSELG
jgi:transcriptional regulator with GAF, ATPase, and Fis domain